MEGVNTPAKAPNFLATAIVGLFMQRYKAYKILCITGRDQS
jgi:hypothetical protein